MSEPKRYEFIYNDNFCSVEREEHEEGDYVSYSDYARLKAEVERLKEGNECLDQMHEKEMARSAFLCEEVNRTTAWGRGLESNLSWARAELLMVKAEVERLTKAGDAMASMLQFEETLNDSDRIPQSVQNWNAAKEGKPSV